MMEKICTKSDIKNGAIIFFLDDFQRYMKIKNDDSSTKTAR